MISSTGISAGLDFFSDSTTIASSSLTILLDSFGISSFLSFVGLVFVTGFFSVNLLGFLVRPVITEVGGVFFETPPFVVVDNFLVVVTVEVARLDLRPFDSDLPLNSDLPLSSDLLDVATFVGFVLVGGLEAVLRVDLY